MDSQTVPSRYRWVKVPGGEGWLGVGASAKEVRLVHLDGDENYKVACKTMTFKDRETQSRIAREHDILTRLQHPNIVAYKDIDQKPNKVKLFMEYCKGGSMQDYIDNVKRTSKSASRIWLEEDWIWNIAKQLSSALAYCHYGWDDNELQEQFPITKKENWDEVLHRDLKPSNVMFTEEVTADSTMPADTIVKLIDFGHGFIIQSDNSPGTFLGTREILPPEIYRLVGKANKWSPLCDIFCLGGTLHSLCALELPTLIPGAEGKTISITTTIDNGHYSRELINIIEKCLSIKPEDRPNALQLYGQAHEHITRLVTTPPNPVPDIPALNSHPYTSGPNYRELKKYKNSSRKLVSVHNYGDTLVRDSARIILGNASGLEDIFRGSKPPRQAPPVMPPEIPDSESKIEK